MQCDQIRYGKERLRLKIRIVYRGKFFTVKRLKHECRDKPQDLVRFDTMNNNDKSTIKTAISIERRILIVET